MRTVPIPGASMLPMAAASSTPNFVAAAGTAALAAFVPISTAFAQFFGMPDSRRRVIVSTEFGWETLSNLPRRCLVGTIVGRNLFFSGPYTASGGRGSVSRCLLRVIDEPPDGENVLPTKQKEGR